MIPGSTQWANRRRANHAQPSLDEHARRATVNEIDEEIPAAEHHTDRVDPS